MGEVGMSTRRKIHIAQVISLPVRWGLFEWLARDLDRDRLRVSKPNSQRDLNAGSARPPLSGLRSRLRPWEVPLGARGVDT